MTLITNFLGWLGEALIVLFCWFVGFILFTLFIYVFLRGAWTINIMPIYSHLYLSGFLYIVSTIIFVSIYFYREKGVHNA